MRNKHPITHLLLLLLLCFFPSVLTASHMVGAEISYTCLGGNRYQITLTHYRDCSGIRPETSAQIDVRSASCGRYLKATVQLSNPGSSGPTLVTPACSTTTCDGASPDDARGIEQVVLVGYITLPETCTDWTFSWRRCCRNALITSLHSPAGGGLYVESSLNSQDAPCNHSPVFTSPPAPYICAGYPYIYYMGASDPDGDSLAYTLVPAQKTQGHPLSYNRAAGYSATTPLLSSPAVNINSHTGEIFIQPNVLQIGVIAVKVLEYRHGSLIGSVTRDLQVRTLHCPHNNLVPIIDPPHQVQNGVLVHPYLISVCTGDSLSFKMAVTDPDTPINRPRSRLVTRDSVVPAGLRFSAKSGNGLLNRDTVSIGWKPGPGDIGTHRVVLVAIDSACPFKGMQTYTLDIQGIQWHLCRARPGSL